MAKTHLLVCQHDACDYAALFMAGDLPATCPTCHRVGHWLIERVYVWSITDVQFLRALKVSPD